MTQNHGPQMTQITQTFTFVTIVLLLLVPVGVGCASNPTRPSAVVLGQSFELRYGASGRLADGVEIRFDAVRSDSRCPSDVQCVWAGDATVAISVMPPAAGRVERELHTQTDAAETVVTDYVIRLTGLAPYPRSDRPVRAGDYVATLTVSRRSQIYRSTRATDNADYADHRGRRGA